MTVSDQSRHQLHQRLDVVLGVQDAATLMEHLPPVGWADVATKRDLDHLEHELRSEMQTGFADVRTSMAELKAEIRSELYSEIGSVRSEVGSLRSEVGVVRGELGRQMQTLFLGLVGLQMSAAGLAIALSKLL